MASSDQTKLLLTSQRADEFGRLNRGPSRTGIQLGLVCMKHQNNVLRAYREAKADYPLHSLARRRLS
jgi:hypothetical protein